MGTIGEGTGIAGRFCGLPNEYSNPQSKVVILPVPFDLTTTYMKGSDRGPAALIEASRNLEVYDIETNSQPYQTGIYTAPSVPGSTSAEMLANVYREVKSYLANDQFVITLGGEHSISPAPIRAHAEKYPGMSVLQLDAHADLVQAYEGDPLSHASAMARVKEIPSITNLVAVGIRSMSVEELPYLDKENTYFAHTLDGSNEWQTKVVDSLAEHVYITFDLDAFDPAIMPSTGTPEPGGLDWYQVMRLLKMVAMKKKIIGFDIVELCPNTSNKGPDFLAAKLLYKMLAYVFNTGVKA